MEINILLLLLITINNLISCNYEVFNNQFSIYFKREYKKIGTDKNFGDEAVNNLLYNNIYSPVIIENNKNPINLFLSFNNSDIKIILSTPNQKDTESNNTFIFPKSQQKLNLNYESLNPNNKEKEKNISYLGLSLINNNKNKISFINQLKENKIIEKRIFSVLFKENSITDDSIWDGQILFGLYPHDMTSRYEEKDLNWISINKLGLNAWSIKFDSIKYHKEETSFNVKEVEFDIGLNLLIGPEEYKIKIYENFFKRQIENKICKEEIFFNKKDNQFYLTYSCDMDLEVNDFPSLSFYSKELNYSLILDYPQLLTIFQKKVYFKVVFKRKAENKKWILGRGFMEIYPLVFDVDNKRIGFYKTELGGQHFFVFIIFLIGIFIILGVTFHRGRQLIKEEKEAKGKENGGEKENKENIKKEENNINNEDETAKLKNE